MRQIHLFLLRFRPYRRFLNKCKDKTLPGLEGLSIYTVFGFLFRELDSEDLNLRASSLSFNFFMALFPAVIFFFTLLAYLPIKDSADQVLLFLSSLMPKNAYLTIKDTVEDILKNQRGGWLSFGFISALYFSTNGIISMIRTFNRFNNVRDTRSFWKKWLGAFLLTMWISILLVLSITLILSTNVVIRYILKLDIFNDHFLSYVLILVRWTILVGLMLLIISSLYYFAPAKKRRWKFISAGGTLATILCIITTIVFSYYVNNFGSYNKVYGSIGTLVAVLLLIHLNSLIMLIGYELNASIDKAIMAKLNPEEITLAKLRSGNYRTNTENSVKNF